MVDMPTTITIRDVPDETRDTLAARAAATGRSLEEYLLAQLVELASRPEPEALLAAVRHRKQHTDSRLSSASILENRDRDRE